MVAAITGSPGLTRDTPGDPLPFANQAICHGQRGARPPRTCYGPVQGTHFI